MAEHQLPVQFVALELFLDWALATEGERTTRRQTVGMDAIRDFYAAMLPRLDEILTFLEGFAPDQVQADVNRLFLLTLSLAEVAPAIENFNQPSVIDGLPWRPGRLFNCGRIQRTNLLPHSAWRSVLHCGLGQHARDADRHLSGRRYMWES